MCGFVGIVTADPRGIPASLAQAMETLVHRGPDDGGTFVAPLGSQHAGFGFRRLAILDLSDSGHQPMVHPLTGDCLVFNGEIYNYLALRRQLEALGDRFLGTSDSEVLLMALTRWGESAVSQLEGMYAFAFYAKKAGRILLARDPLGIKPLYAARHAGHFIFSSEIRAILATGLIPLDLDPKGVASLLAYGAPQDPFTMHSAIRSFPCGAFQWVGNSAEGSAGPTRFWRFPQLAIASSPGGSGETTRLRALIDDAVRTHLVSDVPVGVFLSAGIDSAVVAAIAVQHVNGVRTFTVGFDEPGVADELTDAAMIAHAIGSRHDKLVYNPDRVSSLWSDWLASNDRPCIDGFNTYLISRAAHEQGLKVALSGLGGDELFGGYAVFRNVRRYHLVAQALGLLPRGFRQRLITALSFGMPPSVREKALDMFGTSRTLADVVLHFRRVFSNRQIAALGLNYAELGLPPQYIDAATLQTAVDSQGDDHDDFALVSRLESRLYMGNTLLRDSDGNSMANSLELRVPYLSQPIVDYVTSLPKSIRAPKGALPKHLLRNACAELLPQAVFSRKKTGFTLPLDRWIRGSLRDQCEAAIETVCGSGVLDARQVKRMWKAFVSPESKIRPSRPMTMIALGSYLAQRLFHQRNPAESTKCHRTSRP